jgi:hypothetical protein
MNVARANPVNDSNLFVSGKYSIAKPLNVIAEAWRIIPLNSTKNLTLFPKKPTIQ